MTEKELLSKKTFIDLFKKNELDRIEREDELFIEARKLGIEKISLEIDIIEGENIG